MISRLQILRKLKIFILKYLFLKNSMFFRITQFDDPLNKSNTNQKYIYNV